MGIVLGETNRPKGVQITRAAGGWLDPRGNTTDKFKKYFD